MPLKDVWQGRIALVFWIAAIALGSVQAWSTRFDMAPDGIQYLDDADAYMRGDWNNAANTQWSPMYPWLLGAALKILKPAAYWEFPVVHLVHLVIFLGVLAAFRYFLGGLLATRTKAGVPRNVLASVASAAFLYAMLDFTNLANPTPDLTMAVFVFLLAALIVRMTAGERGPAIFAALGLTLGFGYLAKAPFFVFAVLLLATLALLAIRGALPFSRVAIAAGLFALIAAPYIAFLSAEKGRITYGDSGRYNLIWMVNGIPYYHWQGGPAGNGAPLHPSRKLSDDPAVYEFAAPVSGTYPLWYDPIYWNEGARVQYRPADFLRAAVRNSRLYFWLFHHRQVALLCGVLILFLVAPKRELLGECARDWPLLAFAILPFAMYLPVHADGRFLGAFFALLWSAIFAILIRSASDLPVRFLAALGATVSIMMLIEAALVTVPTPSLTGIQGAAGPSVSRNAQWEIADSLSRLGIRPGDRAAMIGDELPYYWARLARVRIVVDVIPSGSAFVPELLSGRAREWDRAKEILSRTPAQFAIAPAIPGIVDQPGWQRVGATEAFIYRLAR